MSIEGLKIVVTGTFSRGRKEIEGELEDAGADVTGSVSGKTDILVCGEGAGSKLAKAQKLGLPILDEAQMERLLAGDSLEKVLKGGGTKAKAKPGTSKPSGKKPTKVPESGATLDGLKVVCTGTFTQPRKELEARLEEAGADVTGSFSGKTQLLVVGEKAGSKLAKAEKAGIPVINEEQAEALLGGATLNSVIGGKAPKKAAKKKAAPKKAAKKKAAPKKASSGGGLSIEGLKIVVTGKFETPRKELEAALEELGADVTGSFSGKTQLLVAGEKVGSKLGKAQKAGIPIIDEAQLSELLEGASLASILG